MASTLEAAARGLLSDPAWARVFKNTYDAIEEQLNKILVSCAAVALAVRFVSSLTSGDLLCIVNDVRDPIEGYEMSRLAGPAHASLAAYASQEPSCHEQIYNRGSLDLTGFMKYGPVFLILQAITLIGIEKIGFLYPRLNQRLERFYKSVVEEALLGKDPDVAEDFSAGKFSTDKILRERQRQEICGALRGSNLYYNLYLVKNILEVIMAVIFIIINVLIGLDSQDEPGICEIDFIGNPETKLLMQCRQKRYDVFMYLHCIFTVILVFHVLMNICSVVWALPVIGLRRITSLIEDLQYESRSICLQKAANRKLGIKDIETGESTASYENTIISNPLLESEPDDFLFLFDLIAHTCGKSATLRVLSYSAPSFEDLCKPKITNLSMTEDTLKVEWQPSGLQDMTQFNKLEVDEYVATVFSSDGIDLQKLGKDKRSAEFKYLKGGITKYAVTISAVVGKAKMKGDTLDTYLRPFPPQRLRYTSMESTENTKYTKLKLTWTPPKGDFEKYSLRITQIGSRQSILPSMVSLGNFFSQKSRERMPDEIWLPKEAQEHICENLKPGERHQVELKSMTFSTECEVELRETFITKPLPPCSLEVATTADEATISWASPEGEGHTALAGYKCILMTKVDEKVVRENTISSRLGSRSITFDSLKSTVEYTLAIATICSDGLTTIDRRNSPFPDKILEARSEFVEKSFVLLPKPPTNLSLESAQATSLKVRWDPPTDFNLTPKYNITVRAINPDVQAKMSEDMVKETDSNIFTNKVPEVIGTGELYEMSVESVVNISGKFFHSTPIKKVFATKPLPPEKLEVPPPDTEAQEFIWKRSMSPSVQHYKFKIKKDDDKATDYVVEDTEQKYDVYNQQEVKFELPFEFQDGVEYKINIYSIIEHDGDWIESEPLHGRVIKEINYAEQMDPNEKRKSKITLVRKPTNAKPSRKPSMKMRQLSRNEDITEEDLICRLSEAVNY